MKIKKSVLFLVITRRSDVYVYISAMYIENEEKRKQASLILNSTGSSKKYSSFAKYILTCDDLESAFYIQYYLFDAHIISDINVLMIDHINNFVV